MKRLAIGGATAGACLLFAAEAGATQIPFGPGDSFAKLEAAKPGDEVVVAAGTYNFRVHLTQKGTTQKPIVIRAADPANKPVWDLSATLVEDAPGSATTGDRGRGCWQVDGGTAYLIESIVFTGCHDADKNSAGIRYMNGADVTLRDVYIHDNDNGITGGSEGSAALVEWSEIANNGDVTASSPTHNLYIYGGVFGIHYSYVHDSKQGENFHVRAQFGLIEANWFSRAKSYEGDLMTSVDAKPGAGFLQSLVIRGNVFVQADAPDNTAQIFALLNDTKVDGTAFDMRIVNNTFIGSGKNSALVHLADTDKTPMQVEVSNNILYAIPKATIIDDATGIVVGASNFMPTGGDVGPLVDTIFGTDPGFTNFAKKDYTLNGISPLLGKASGIPKQLPPSEYYKDEILARKYRVRATAHDIGAFESTTAGPSYGPYDPPPVPDAGPPPPNTDSGIPIPAPGGSSSGNPGFTDAGATDAGNGANPGGSSSGCSCRATQNESDAPFAGIASLVGTVLALSRISASRAARKRCSR